MPPLVNTDFTPFSPLASITYSISIFNYALGILGNLTLLLLWWIHRKTDSDYYSVLVIITNLTAIFSFVAEAMAHSLEGFNDNRLGPGSYYCVAIGVIAFSNCLTNLLAITLYSYQRYRIILKKNPLPLSACLISIGIYFISYIILTTSPYFYGESFIYRPAGTYCIFDWKSRTTNMTLFNIFNMLVVSTCIIGLCYMYSQILMYSRKVAKELLESNCSKATESHILNANGQNDDMEVVEKEFSVIQKRLVKRIIIIVLFCFLNYTPYYCGGIYEMLWGNEVSPLTNAILSILVVSNSLCDFIVFIATNSAYRRTFWSLFGLRFIN